MFQVSKAVLVHAELELRWPPASCSSSREVGRVTARTGPSLVVFTGRLFSDAAGVKDSNKVTEATIWCERTAEHAKGGGGVLRCTPVSLDPRRHDESIK